VSVDPGELKRTCLSLRRNHLSSFSNGRKVSAKLKYAVHLTVKRLISLTLRSIETPQLRVVS
jgi:hypothetical protein